MKQNVQDRYSRGAALWKFALILAGTICCLFTSLASSAGQFVIVSGGQPKAEIVVDAEHAQGPLTFATQELQRYVKQMSGADLAVVHAPTKKPVIALAVGPLQQDKKASEDPREKDHYRLSID